jgi:hypothetical protein
VRRTVRSGGVAIFLAAAGLASGPAVGLAQRQAVPCIVASVTLDEGSLPRGASLVPVAEQPTAEIPFKIGTVLVNGGRTPLYMVSQSPYKYEADRRGSGVPLAYYPHYKLVSGKVYEWSQDTSKTVGMDQSAGLPIYGWHWVQASSGFLYRATDAGAGLLLLPDASAYLKSDGPPVDIFDCSGKLPQPRSVRVTAFVAGEPVTIDGMVSFQRRSETRGP